MPRTILILGAGASFPYGFPLGTKLVEEIIRYTKVSGGGHLSLRRILEQEFDTISIEKFRKDLAACDINSIDSFLFHNQHYIEIGKACIAYILLKSETESRLNSDIEDNWYKYFWNEISSRDPESFDFKIYTFNYERSLHKYLKDQIRYLFPEAKKRQSFLNNIQIVHLHGSLGEIEYGGILMIKSYMQLKEVADNIKVIFEVEKDETFRKLQKEIKAAKHVVFTGFGFHEDNMKRLGFTLGKFLNMPQFYASTFGLLNAELETKYERFVKDALQTHSEFMVETYKNYAISENSKNLDFLREKFPFHHLFKS